MDKMFACLGSKQRRRRPPSRTTTTATKTTTTTTNETDKDNASDNALAASSSSSSLPSSSSFSTKTKCRSKADGSRFLAFRSSGIGNNNNNKNKKKHKHNRRKTTLVDIGAGDESSDLCGPICLHGLTLEEARQRVEVKKKKNNEAEYDDHDNDSNVATNSETSTIVDVVSERVVDDKDTTAVLDTPLPVLTTVTLTSVRLTNNHHHHHNNNNNNNGIKAGSLDSMAAPVLPVSDASLNVRAVSARGELETSKGDGAANSNNNNNNNRKSSYQQAPDPCVLAAVSRALSITSGAPTAVPLRRLPPRIHSTPATSTGSTSGNVGGRSGGDAVSMSESKLAGNRDSALSSTLAPRMPNSFDLSSMMATTTAPSAKSAPNSTTTTAPVASNVYVRRNKWQPVIVSASYPSVTFASEAASTLTLTLASTSISASALNSPNSGGSSTESVVGAICSNVTSLAPSPRQPPAPGPTSECVQKMSHFLSATSASDRMAAAAATSANGTLDIKTRPVSPPIPIVGAKTMTTTAAAAAAFGDDSSSSLASRMPRTSGSIIAGGGTTCLEASERHIEVDLSVSTGTSPDVDFHGFIIPKQVFRTATIDGGDDDDDSSAEKIEVQRAVRRLSRPRSLLGSAATTSLSSSSSSDSIEDSTLSTSSLSLSSTSGSVHHCRRFRPDEASLVIAGGSSASTATTASMRKGWRV